MATDCEGTGKRTCIEVPNSLELQAADYARTTDPNVRIGGRTRLGWETETLQTLTHEVQHIKFDAAAPVGAKPTMNTQKVYGYSPDIFLAELDELNALLSEYPIRYRATMASTNVAPADKPAAISGWIGSYAIANGMEDIRGMLAKLRCVSTCQDVNDAVTTLFTKQSANWTAEEKTKFLTEVNDPKYKLDWPVPAPAASR